METKIKIEITQDYNSQLSYDYLVEDITEILNNIDIYCETSNNNFINVIEELQSGYNSNKDNYDKELIINAYGYSQSDWQQYVIYYNSNIDTFYLDRLTTLLSRSFTHQNDYQVTKKEILIKDNKSYENVIDYTNFCITEIEFPDTEDIKQEYLNCYGKDYDEIEININ